MSSKNAECRALHSNRLLRTPCSPSDNMAMFLGGPGTNSGAGSLGSVLTGSPQPPLSPFHIRGWNPDGAVGTPEHLDAVQMEVTAWAAAQQEPGCQLRAASICQGDALPPLPEQLMSDVLLQRTLPYPGADTSPTANITAPSFKETRPSAHTPSLYGLPGSSSRTFSSPLRTTPAGFHMALINKQCHLGEHSWLLCPKHSC